LTTIDAQSVAQHFRLDGKVALVPGGYGGIGEAVCWGLASAGAKVAVAGHYPERTQLLVESLQQAGHEAFAAPFDAHQVRDIQRMTDDVAAHFGQIDILVNCVGLNREEKLLDVTEANFDFVYSANLKSALFLAQAAAKHMIQQGNGGKQVHLGSVRTLLGLRGRGYSAYTAAKGGLGTMCKQLAAELAPHKINVNVVAPTFTRTEMVTDMLSEQDFYDSLIARIPLGRIAEPLDIMYPILFLTSPASNFITGQII
jgi:NAD(P)-dependent dehydrogenase (short-subunit alcohol dehydrogenase family)